MGIFERYLSVWVGLGIILGVVMGYGSLIYFSWLQTSKLLMLILLLRYSFG